MKDVVMNRDEDITEHIDLNSQCGIYELLTGLLAYFAVLFKLSLME